MLSLIVMTDMHLLPSARSSMNSWPSLNWITVVLSSNEVFIEYTSFTQDILRIGLMILPQVFTKALTFISAMKASKFSLKVSLYFLFMKSAVLFLIRFVSGFIVPLRDESLFSRFILLALLYESPSFIHAC